MAEQTNYDKQFFERASNLLRVHGLISIIFGSIGVFFGLIFMVIMGIAGVATAQLGDVIGAFAMGVFTLVLFVLPHVYLIIAGIQLMKQPQPKVAKTLVIINLIVGVFWNLVLLIFAIINLTQIGDYEAHYSKYAEKK